MPSSMLRVAKPATKEDVERPGRYSHAERGNEWDGDCKLGSAMWLRDNPVLARELLVNLRSPRAFILQLMYVAFLAAVVYFSWPAGEGGAHQVSSGAAQRLFELFFLGQFFLV